MKLSATALSCALLLQGAGVHASGVVWPEPSLAQPVQQSRPLQTAPNFKAPAASDCRRAPRLIDRPDPYRRPQQARPRPHGSGVTLHGGSDAAMAVEGTDLSAAPMPSAEAAADRAPPPPEPGARAPQAPTAMPPPRPRQEVVTVGMVDDNADFGEYLQFRQRTPVPHRPRDVSERHLLQVQDADGHGVADAEVAVQSTGNRAAMWARTDSSGRAWIHPNAFDDADSPQYRVTVRHQGAQQSAVLQRGQKSAIDLKWPQRKATQAARLDLVFMIDATGSMADEIDKLKHSLQGIVREVSQLPSQPDICLGLVAYRDRGDAFFVRGWDLTNDVAAFQRVLDDLRAGGGGDYPEAMSEALHLAVQDLSWRGAGTSRMLIALADAPPQLHYGGPQYDEQMLAALGKGIKLSAVGASGLDKQGETIMRQLAQYTGGRFIFLTYADAQRPASGPGRETTHDVRNYSVETLDRLIVRLVTDELAPLAAAHLQRS